VRKALYHGINISEIIDTVLNGSNFAEPASQFVSPMIFGYNPTIERLPYDPEFAKSLMRNAGYEDGFELVLDCPDVEDQVQICTLLQRQLSEIIDVKVNVLSIEAFYSKLTSRNSSCYIVGWHVATGDGGEIFDYMIRTVDEEAGIGTYNMGYYSNTEVDRRGENISHMLNSEERRDLMQEGFKIAMDDVAWIPLYIPTIIYCIRNDIAWDPTPNMMIAVEEISFIT
jgi:peptide/nickel transport system substrate-binding protein